MNIRRESGLTLIGFIIVLAMVLFFIYAGMRIVPMYLEYHALGNALQVLQDDPASKKITSAEDQAKDPDEFVGQLCQQQYQERAYPHFKEEWWYQCARTLRGQRTLPWQYRPHRQF